MQQNQEYHLFLFNAFFFLKTSESHYHNTSQLQRPARDSASPLLFVAMGNKFSGSPLHHFDVNVLSNDRSSLEASFCLNCKKIYIYTFSTLLRIMIPWCSTNTGNHKKQTPPLH